MTSRAGPCSSEQTGVFISCSRIRYLLSIWQSLASRLEYCREIGGYLHPGGPTGKASLPHRSRQGGTSPKVLGREPETRNQGQGANACHRPPAVGPSPLRGLAQDSCCQ